MLQEGLKIYLIGGYKPYVPEMECRYRISSEDIDYFSFVYLKEEGSPVLSLYLGLEDALKVIKDNKWASKILFIASCDEIFIKQVKGRFSIRSEKIRDAFFRVHRLLRDLSFVKVKLVTIPRRHLLECFDETPNPYTAEDLEKLFDVADLDSRFI